MIPGLLAAIAVFSYLLGGLNGAIIASKYVFHRDVRDYGSGNAGLTNFYRTFGAPALAIVIGTDVLKTVIAVVAGGLIMGTQGAASTGQVFAGFCVMLGHIYPVFYGFRGGKGVLCAETMLLIVSFPTGLVSLLIFVGIVWATRYVSLGSICGALSGIRSPNCLLRKTCPINLTTKIFETREEGMKPMLELKHLCFEAETDDGVRQILKDVSLTVDERMVVITGPNGSGKSTMAKLIAGIEQPTSGQILLDGEDITHMSITERARRGISFAFQQPVRFKGITVFDLISIASGKKLSTNEACTYLSEVGLCARDYVNREVNASLSGGELKRIEIATMLARGTKMSIFDEPEAGIDLWSFQNLISVFEKMHEAIHGSILIISHQERILETADKIVVLVDGEIRAIGSKDEIMPVLMQASSVCSRLADKV